MLRPICFVHAIEHGIQCCSDVLTRALLEHIDKILVKEAETSLIQSGRIHVVRQIVQKRVRDTPNPATSSVTPHTSKDKAKRNALKDVLICRLRCNLLALDH